MESAGVRLKKIRLEKGLSLEEVHKKTKIHLSILKAIEEDNLVGISPIYIKGFLKIYCKLLDVDPKDYISGYQESARIIKEVPAAPERTVAPTGFIKRAPLKLDYFKGFNIKIKSIAVFIVVIFLILGLFNLGISVSRRRISRRAQGKTSPSLARIANKANTSKSQSTKLEWTQKDTKAIADIQTKEETAPKLKAVSSGIRLIIRARDNCWLHLSSDGKVVFHAILKKNKFETWQAKEKIEFSLGNAGAVDLELNGKTIPPLGRRGQAVKNALITKEAGLVLGR